MAWFFRHGVCREKLRQLEDRLATVESDQRRLTTEWISQLDAFQKLVERWVKRVERAEKNNGAPRGEAEPSSGPDPISARIIARRAAHVVRPQLRAEQG